MIPISRAAKFRSLPATVSMLRLAGSRSYSNFGREEVELRTQLGTLLNHHPEAIVTFSSATMAITAAIECLGIPEIEIPSFTFAGTAQGALRSKANTKISDIIPNSLSARVSVPVGESKHKAVVTILGCRPHVENVGPKAFQKKYAIVDDAAGLANSLNSRRVPALAEAHVFSLHATKPFGGGEGGLVVVQDTHLAKELRQWTNFGFNSSRISERSGYNGKLSEFDALAAKLRLSGRHRTLRELRALRSRAKRVEGALGLRGIQGINDYSPYWTVDFGSRREADLVAHALSLQGIESRRWWGDGLHTMRAYQNELVGESFNQTDQVAGSLLSLPFFGGMSRKQFSTIEGCLEAAIDRQSEPPAYRA